jgi:hypothetical protein
MFMKEKIKFSIPVKRIRLLITAYPAKKIQAGMMWWKTPFMNMLLQ